MKKITFSLPVVVIISLIIQVLGLIKSLLLASNFGANSTLDAFYLANVFTISIFSVINSAVTTVVIPALNKDEEIEKKNQNIANYVSIIETFSVLLSVIFFLFILIFREQISPNFNNQVQLIFISATFILMVSQQFRIRAGVSVSVFQSEGHYILPRFLDILPAFFPVLYLVVKPQVSIVELTLSIAVGYVLETIFLNIFQKKMDDRYVFKFKIRFTEKVKSLLQNTFPVIISSAVFQLQVLLSNYFASNFGKGYVTLLSNTNQVMGIFQGLFVGNIINMIYPNLVRDLLRNFKKGLSKAGNYISVTNLIVIVLLWGYFAVGKDLVTFLFVHGKFTSSNAEIVFRFSLILGLALPIDVIRDYFYRIYYSLGNTRIPMVNSIVTVIFNILLLAIGSNFFGPIILVVAPSVGTLWSCITISVRARSNDIKIPVRKVLGGLVFANAIGFFMYLVIRLINFESPILLFRLMVNVFIGASTICVFGVIVFLILKSFKEKNFFK